MQRSHVLSAMAARVAAHRAADQQPPTKKRKGVAVPKSRPIRRTLVPSEETVPANASPDVPYQISSDTRNGVHIKTYLKDVGGDPAYHVRDPTLAPCLCSLRRYSYSYTSSSCTSFDAFKVTKPKDIPSPRVPI